MKIIVIDNKILCRHCCLLKEIEDFPRDKSRKLGIETAQCNECKAKRARKLYENKSWIFKKSSIKWNQNNKDKKRAYGVVSYAIKTGRIKRPDKCQICGKIKKLDAHHWHGYEKKFILDVQWLCRICHNKEA